MAHIAWGDGATQAELLWLARRGPACVRAIVAGRDDTPAKAFELLARDPNEYVRSIAVNNSDAPESVRMIKKLEEL
jgi:hypothetical protein